MRSTWQEFAAIYAWMARSLSQTRLPGEVLLRLENSPVEWSAAQYEAASIIDFDAKEPCGFDPCRRQVSTASSRRMRRRVRLRTLFRRFQDDPTLVTSFGDDKRGSFGVRTPHFPRKSPRGGEGNTVRTHTPGTGGSRVPEAPKRDGRTVPTEWVRCRLARTDHRAEELSWFMEDHGDRSRPPPRLGGRDAADRREPPLASAPRDPRDPSSGLA